MIDLFVNQIRCCNRKVQSACEWNISVQCDCVSARSTESKFTVEVLPNLAKSRSDDNKSFHFSNAIRINPFKNIVVKGLN